ncbi:RNA-binding protein S4 [Saccharopolyspora subtropica]|uniref:RNA-binding S4 domain-containing protein n=1 Tax=Saccharopolyspora thermophila TaxID=89367 RepID=A0A917NL75_9PSEU|nr:RNA-binding S4 domain-containing protein [Saccharopolyspora subtropica]GGJ05973.1 RNA-binding protein S4 [Saccharopolyspora subtropica]
MRDVEIRDDAIRLGQLLKLAGLVEHGAAAKAVLEDGQVRVNGAVETRRGKQVTAGDEVTVGDEVLRVVTARR